MAGTALKEQIRGDLNSARRDRDRLRTTVLTTLLSDLRNREIEVGHELSDEEVLPVVSTGIKRRREAAEQMRAGGREELAAKEDEEARILAVYLPPQLDEDRVRAYVRDAIAGGAGDLGGVMKAVMPRVRGQFDGRELNRIVREELG
ncbi:MAG TPA: GatB/YqeY domain-containing protein [Longimicrobiaceae bacterium]|nr:GatB/YqeY domain-containing protein [Longimicrobiaceae bacterium]